MREPEDRLGAGPPGSNHDMLALRAHPFLATVQWTTLWVDPAPPLEAGLVKRMATRDPACVWKDVGADWDELVGDEESYEEDGIEWAEDTDGGSGAIFIRGGANGARDEDSDIRDLPNGHGNGVGHADRAAVVSEPIKVMVQPRDRSAGSGTSSGGGSPVERLGAMIESISLKRGRDECRTPVQGNLPGAEEEDWYVCAS